MDDCLECPLWEGRCLGHCEADNERCKLLCTPLSQEEEEMDFFEWLAQPTRPL